MAQTGTRLPEGSRRGRRSTLRWGWGRPGPRAPLWPMAPWDSGEGAAPPCSGAGPAIGHLHGRRGWRRLPSRVAGGLGPGPRWPVLPPLPRRTWGEAGRRAVEKSGSCCCGGLGTWRSGGARVGGLGPCGRSVIAVATSVMRWAMSWGLTSRSEAASSGWAFGWSLSLPPERPASHVATCLRPGDRCPVSGGAGRRPVCSRPPRPAGPGPRGSVLVAFRGLCLASRSRDRWWLLDRVRADVRVDGPGPQLHAL